eukprot:12915452-Prorocentrum_lima.AAC.1
MGHPKGPRRPTCRSNSRTPTKGYSSRSHKGIPSRAVKDCEKRERRYGISNASFEWSGPVLGCSH